MSTYFADNGWRGHHRPYEPEGVTMPGTVPDEPWYPKDVEAWSVRWVVMHLIEETAGHADIV